MHSLDGIGLVPIGHWLQITCNRVQRDITQQNSIKFTNPVSKASPLLMPIHITDSITQDIGGGTTSKNALYLLRFGLPITLQEV